MVKLFFPGHHSVPATMQILNPDGHFILRHRGSLSFGILWLLNRLPARSNSPQALSLGGRSCQHSSHSRWVCNGCSEAPWRRKWQATPAFPPGKCHGQRSLAGYSLWGRESRTQLSDWAHAEAQEWRGCPQRSWWGRKWKWKGNSLSWVQLFAAPWNSPGEGERLTFQGCLSWLVSVVHHGHVRVWSYTRCHCPQHTVGRPIPMGFNFGEKPQHYMKSRKVLLIMVVFSH